MVNSQSSETVMQGHKFGLLQGRRVLMRILGIRSSDFMSGFLPFFIYLLFNAFLRWYSWPIFIGDYRWGQPSLLVTALIITTISLQFWVVCFCFYYIVNRFFYSYGNHIFLFFGWLLLCYSEADLAWYAVSKSHIALADIAAFMTQNWQYHFGFQTSHFIAYLKPCLMHAFSVTVFYLLYRHRHRYWLFAKTSPALVRRSVGRSGALTALLLANLLIIGSSYLGSAMNVEQWSWTFNKHILGEWSLNKVLLKDKYDDIATQYNKLYSTRNKYSFSQLNAPIKQNISRRKDVLVIAVEGLSSNYLDAKSTPYLHHLTSQGIHYQNHFSTGNSTSNGVLGLLYGMPTAFYNRLVLNSRYLDFFNRQGYKTSWYGKRVLEHNMAVYFDDFQIKPDTNISSSKIIQDVQDNLAEQQNSLIFIYYRETHWPYLHDTKFKPFFPEVADDFVFSGERLMANKTKIINKYRNALFQFDHWLASLLEKVDLEQTLVLIVGDHGEEMFETGRLSHSSTLNGPMTKTPAILLAPDLTPKKITTVTSHANLFPTLLHLLGINTSDKNDFIIPSVLENNPQNIAISAKNSQGFAVSDWVVISNQFKLMTSNNQGAKFDILDVLTLEDEKVSSMAPVTQDLRLMEGLKMLNDLTTEKD
jgi:hypothetical protein